MMFSWNLSYAPNISEYFKDEQLNQIISKVRTAELTENNLDSISYKQIMKFKLHNFDKESRKKVRKIAIKLGIKEVGLYKIMYIESRGNPQAVYYRRGDNKDPSIRCNYRATGLIQFLPSTSIALGTTNAELFKMSLNEQLDYVEKYLIKAIRGRKIRSTTDLYLAVFSPSCFGMNDSHIVSKDTNIIAANNGLNTNKDSVITVKDIREFIMDLTL